MARLREKKKKKQKERESKREKWSHYSRPLTGAACFCSTSRGDWILACTEETKCVCTSRCVYTRAHYTENCSIYIICIYRSVCVSEYSRDLPCYTSDGAAEYTKQRRTDTVSNQKSSGMRETDCNHLLKITVEPDWLKIIANKTRI